MTMLAMALLYNVTGFSGIKKLSITYLNSSGNSSQSGMNIKYGSTFPLTYISSASYSSVSNTYSVTSSSGFDYFYIEAAGSANLSISQIDIYYTSSETSAATYADVATDQYRINPVKSTASLVSGTTTVSIPTAISRSGSTYSIVESKTLTYYAYDDVINGGYTAEEASVTDPFDIAAYYCAFGKAPANFVLKGSVSSTDKSVFGSYLRCNQWFNWTDGYVNAVPNLKNASNFSTLGYNEFDVALNSAYSTSKRGIGRVIVFSAGLPESGYDSSPYVVYSDDHYATFQEFYGYGFSPRFDSQTNRTGYIWSNPTTLS